MIPMSKLIHKQKGEGTKTNIWTRQPQSRLISFVLLVSFISHSILCLFISYFGPPLVFAPVLVVIVVVTLGNKKHRLSWCVCRKRSLSDIFEALRQCLCFVWIAVYIRIILQHQYDRWNQPACMFSTYHSIENKKPYFLAPTDIQKWKGTLHKKGGSGKIWVPVAKGVGTKKVIISPWGQPSFIHLFFVIFSPMILQHPGLPFLQWWWKLSPRFG